MSVDSLVRARWRLWDRPLRELNVAARDLRADGPATLLRHAMRAARDARTYGRDLDSRYRLWLSHVAHEFVRVPDAELFAEVARAPRFLLIAWLPAGREVEAEPLLRSLRQQPYPHWHLWMVGREPVDDRAEERVYNRVPGEKRLHVAKDDPARRGGRPWDRASVVNEIVAASAHTTHVAFADPTDRLAPEALLRLTERIFADDPDILYMDEDQMTAWGRRVGPRFKPEWSPEFLLSYHYFGHLTLYRRDLFLAAGGLSSGEDGRLEYDLALRATERAGRVAHLAHVLCHRATTRVSGFRAVLGSEEGAGGAEGALHQALQRRGVESRVERARLPGTWRVRPVIAPESRAVIVVLTHDRAAILRRCVNQMDKHTRWTPRELVIVDNASRENRTRRYLEGLSHRVIADPGPYNPARLLNLAARETTGDALVFLDVAARVRDGWLEALLEALALPGVGAAGAKLLHPGGTVRSAGLILGVGEVAGDSHAGLPASFPGYLGSLQVLRNYSAASAACLAVKRMAFELAGGFDESLASGFHDVDLCLRLATLGLRTVVTPWSVVALHGPPIPGAAAPATPAGDSHQRAALRERWGEALIHDPAYHPLLARDHGDFQMARWDRERLPAGGAGEALAPGTLSAPADGGAPARQGSR